MSKFHKTGQGSITVRKLSINNSGLVSSKYNKRFIIDKSVNKTKLIILFYNFITYLLFPKLRSFTTWSRRYNIRSLSYEVHQPRCNFDVWWWGTTDVPIWHRKTFSGGNSNFYVLCLFVLVCHCPTVEIHSGLPVTGLTY